MRKNISDKFDVQACEIAKTSSLSQKNGIDIDTVGVRVQSLERGLASSQQDVEKLRSTLDLTQEYWKGLTKGLRQTHRSIAVENEMFSTKGSGYSGLPALTKTVSPQGSLGGNMTSR